MDRRGTLEKDNTPCLDTHYLLAYDLRVLIFSHFSARADSWGTFDASCRRQQSWRRSMDRPQTPVTRNGRRLAASAYSWNVAVMKMSQPEFGDIQ
jgi:hypothetical protein